MKEILFESKAISMHLSENKYYLVVLYLSKVNFYNFQTKELLFSIKLKHAGSVSFSKNYCYCAIRYGANKICVIDMKSYEIIYKTNSLNAEGKIVFINNEEFIFYQFKLSDKQEEISSSVMKVNLVTKTKEILFTLKNIMLFKLENRLDTITFLGAHDQDAEEYHNDIVFYHCNISSLCEYEIHMVRDVVYTNNSAAYNHVAKEYALDIFNYAKDNTSIINIYNKDSGLIKRLNIDSLVNDFFWIKNGEKFFVQKINGIEIFDSETFESVYNIDGLTISCDTTDDGNFICCLFTDGCRLYTLEDI